MTEQRIIQGDCLDVFANARLAFWAGITPQTLEGFILTGDMPGQTAADARQGSLF